MKCAGAAVVAAYLLVGLAACTAPDGLFSEQVNESNPRVRAQILAKIQQIMHERAMFIPVIQPAFLNGVGSRVEAYGLGAIEGFAYSAPYEDLTLKAGRGKP
jgi:peptide/nickel transport system substrate-binding protein